MAGHGPKKRLAPDTNVLLALAEGRDYAHDFRERFQAAGYTLLASPTVFQELTYAGLYETEPTRSNARKAIYQAAQWALPVSWCGQNGSRPRTGHSRFARLKRISTHRTSSFMPH